MPAAQYLVENYPRYKASSLNLPTLLSVNKDLESLALLRQYASVEEYMFCKTYCEKFQEALLCSKSPQLNFTVLANDELQTLGVHQGQLSLPQYVAHYIMSSQTHATL